MVQLLDRQRVRRRPAAARLPAQPPAFLLLEPPVRPAKTPPAFAPSRLRVPSAPEARPRRPGLRGLLPSRLPLELGLGLAIVACVAAFAWIHRAAQPAPLSLPADGAYEAWLSEALAAEGAASPRAQTPALEPSPEDATRGRDVSPASAPGGAAPAEGFGAAAGSRLPPRVIESLKVVSYELKPGDSISKIAERFSLNLDTLLSYNDIRDARRLAVGRVLQVPNTDGLKHRVSRGEHLGGIATRYGIPLNSLLDWNSLDSSMIRPGQELFIPGGRLKPQELRRILGDLFIYPAKGRVSSGFGMRRDPFTGIRRFHNGMDIANDPGTVVAAAMAGRVAMAGYNANFGKYVIVSHPEGFQTLYGHLQEFLVRRGQPVSQGQAIGRMGNTGYSTGPHLHFSVFQRGEPVDPLRYLR